MGALYAQGDEYARFWAVTLFRLGGLFREPPPYRRSTIDAALIDVMQIQESVSGVDAQASETRALVGPTGAPLRKWSPEASGRRRPMIAVLIHYIERTSGGYEQMLRGSLAAAFRQHDFDFTVVCGAAIDDPAPDLLVTNELYRYVDEQHFDGAILASTGLCRYLHPDRLLKRLPQLKNLALCSIGLRLKGIPSVTSDTVAGMSAAVEHLISVHGRRRLAFLGAKWQDADISCRREVFLDVNRRHGLEVPPHRLIECWLEPTSGELVVTELLRQDPMVDAIVAGNDGAAMGAVAALKRFGRRVPLEISVTGFDDLPMALLTDPSIATVSQRIDTLANLAVANIAQQLAGSFPPAVREVATELVVRESCGCPASQDESQSAQLPKGALRRAHAERFKLETMYRLILEFAGNLSVASSSTELEYLTGTGIPVILPTDCFAGLYTDATHQVLKPILRRRGDDSSALLPNNASFLERLGDTERPRALLLMALAAPHDLFGIIAFEIGDHSVDYPAIASHIANAWHMVQLREEIVDQRMLAERRLQERQAAAERSRATSTLASGVAHDLNNALGPLISLADVVAEEISEHRASGKLLDAEVIDDLQTIRASALRAAETIKDLMTLGRIGRTCHEPFDLARLVQHLVAIESAALARANASSVQIRLQVAEPESFIVGSEPHIERAIGNILRNAIEAAGRGGAVDVAVGRLNLQQRTRLRESVPPGDYVVVSIRDNGPGIPDDASPRIFEPFFSTKRLGESSGSGLGLAIVYSVVKEHRGYVDVTSRLGEGATFMIYLPRTEPTSRQRSGPPSVVRGSARILVVDDDLTQLRAAKRVLSRRGYAVTVMSSGALAYEHLVSQSRVESSPTNPGAMQAAPRTSAFDLVILDLALNEEEDGIQLFDRIRAIYPEQKGILASGHASVDHEEQIRSSQLVWLPKPYTVEALTAAIRAALDDRDTV